MAHTPGPWTPNPLEPWIVGQEASDGKEVAEALGTSIEFLDFYSDPERQDNAALIALAPTAPHDCDDAECPGRLLKETFRLLLEGCKVAETALSALHGDHEGGTAENCTECAAFPILDTAIAVGGRVQI